MTILTVCENIRYAKSDATDAEVEENKEYDKKLWQKLTQFYFTDKLVVTNLTEGVKER